MTSKTEKLLNRVTVLCLGISIIMILLANHAQNKAIRKLQDVVAKLTAGKVE